MMFAVQAMTPASWLRIMTLLCCTVMIVAAACLAAAAGRRDRTPLSAIVIGVVAVTIVYVAFQLFRSGYYFAYDPQ